MSWLFGILRKNGSDFPKFELNEEFQKVLSDTLFLATNPQNHSTSLTVSENEVNAIVGIPIIDEQGTKTLYINNSSVKIDSLKNNGFYGHFVHVRYIAGKLTIANDTFGLRDLYYYNTQDHFYFSTRLDLLKMYLKELSLDPEEFSSLWLTNFQLSKGSIIQEINRLGPGGKILIDREKFDVTNNELDFASPVSNSESLNENISMYCMDTLSSKNKLLLALSGGIDSRLILSSLFKNKQSFECYSLQNDEDKDIEISKKICKSLNIPHTLIARQKISIGEIEDKILTYYKSIPPVIPLSQLLDFIIFGADYLKGKIIIDGGFGGFYRRQYFNRLFFQGYKKFNSNNSPLYSKLLYSPKPDVFNNEFSTKLSENYENQIFKLISQYKIPEDKEGLSQILDDISIKYMLPSIYGAGQTILDQELISIMPLVQKDTVQIGFQLPFREKVGSKFFKEIICSNYPMLTEFNLVNNNLLSNFNTNYKLFRLKLLIRKRMFRKGNFNRYNFILNSKDYVGDLLNSSIIKNDDYLNYDKSITSAEKFYAGSYEESVYMDWLLTFAMWRKANNNII